MKDLRTWTIKDSAELYNIAGWSNGFFRINEAGHVEVHAARARGSERRHVRADPGPATPRVSGMPLLVRFSDILDSRVRALAAASAAPSSEYGYRGRYRGVYPIKVNQQHQVVEELVRFGAPGTSGSRPDPSPSCWPGWRCSTTPTRCSS